MLASTAVSVPCHVLALLGGTQYVECASFCFAPFTIQLLSQCLDRLLFRFTTSAVQSYYHNPRLDWSLEFLWNTVSFDGHEGDKKTEITFWFWVKVVYISVYIEDAKDLG